MADGRYSEKASLVVIQTNVPDLNIRFQEDAGIMRLASGNVTVNLSNRDGAIQFVTAGNRNLLKEQGPAGYHAGPNRSMRQTRSVWSRISS